MKIFNFSEGIFLSESSTFYTVLFLQSDSLHVLYQSIECLKYTFIFY